MTPDEIADLLHKRMGLDVPAELSSKLARYLELLMHWNARTNLTAVRSEEQIVLRHFGESLQCAKALQPYAIDLLDYGSGAGFPGLVCALAKPTLNVLLAESQGKKAGFLREACRAIPVQADVHAGRVEALPATRLFDVVTMRAVDRMEAATQEAVQRVRNKGWLVVMTTRTGVEQLAAQLPRTEWANSIALRGTDQGVIAMGQVCRE